MNWKWLKFAPWIDTRARFVSRIPKRGHLLDLGCSDGSTLSHFLELRPDLQIYAVDINEHAAIRKINCIFHKANLETDPLPWPDASMDAITCMHLLEHLRTHNHLLAEIARLLKPGAQAYFEMPRPKTLILDSPRGKAAGTFTLNFFDDPTHVGIISTGRLANWLREHGLEVVQSGISRNILFALAYPFASLLLRGRYKYISKAHWHGWSVFVIAEKRP